MLINVLQSLEDTILNYSVFYTLLFFLIIHDFIITKFIIITYTVIAYVSTIKN